METIKMNVAKSLVLIALLCSFAYAEGEQGSGGFASTERCPVASLDGEQGSGGLTSGPCIEGENETDSFFKSILEYFGGSVQ